MQQGLVSSRVKVDVSILRTVHRQGERNARALSTCGQKVSVCCIRKRKPPIVRNSPLAGPCGVGIKRYPLAFMCDWYAGGGTYHVTMDSDCQSRRACTAGHGAEVDMGINRAVERTLGCSP